MTVPPYPTSPGEQPRAAGPAPQEVETAFRLLMTNVVLGLIGAILSFSTVSAVVDERLKAGGVATANEAAVRAGIVIGVVIGLVILALYIFFAFQMRAGKNWARIVLTVLGALAVLFSLIGIGGYSDLINAGILGLLSVIISIVQLGLIAAALYFMFRPASNAYFTAPTYG